MLLIDMIRRMLTRSMCKLESDRVHIPNLDVEVAKPWATCFMSLYMALLQNRDKNICLIGIISMCCVD